MAKNFDPTTGYGGGNPAQGDWRKFVAVGAVLVACGVGAILAPTVATFATTTLLGSALMIAGVACVYQAMQAQDWTGYNWQLLLGAAEIVGGLFIVITPLKGAAAVTLLVAIVVIAMGLAQVGLALKVRPQAGWMGLLGASVVSLLVGAMLIVRFPFDYTDSPGVMAGISLVAGGLAHAIVGLGQRAVGIARST